MATITYVEVYCIIVPLMGVLLSFTVPVSVFQKAVAAMVQQMEKPNFGGLTVLTFLAIITSFAFLSDFLYWQSYFEKKETQFPDISLKLQHDTKRLRVERNLYIHMLACALCLAVKRIAVLTRPRAVVAPQPTAAPQGRTKSD